MLASEPNLIERLISVQPPIIVFKCTTGRLTSIRVKKNTIQIIIDGEMRYAPFRSSGRYPLCQLGFGHGDEAWRSTHEWVRSGTCWAHVGPSWRVFLCLLFINSWLGDANVYIFKWHYQFETYQDNPWILILMEIVRTERIMKKIKWHVILRNGGVN